MSDDQPGVGVLRVDECEQPGVSECEWHSDAHSPHPMASSERQ